MKKNKIKKKRLRWYLKISLTVMSVPLGDLHLEVAKLTS